MNKGAFLAATIVALVGLVVSGCGTPAAESISAPSSPIAMGTQSPLAATPTTEVIELDYTNPAWGLSVSYPDDWVLGREGRQNVSFGSSEQAAAEEPLETGASLKIMRTTLEGRSADDVFQVVIDTLTSPDMVVGDAQPRTIAGLDGLIATLDGTDEGGQVPVRGFVAGVEYEGWLYLAMAEAVLGEPAEYGLDLEAMLDSIRFTGRTWPTPIPSDVIEPNYSRPAMGLSIWHPDDWNKEWFPEGWMYEYTEQVIFTNSEALFRGAELETGAAMMVYRVDPRGERDDDWIEEWVSSAFSGTELEPRDPQPRMIGGQPGIVATLEGTSYQVPYPAVKGFVAGAEYYHVGYFFIAYTVLDEWPEYGPVLEMMLDSVRFIYY